MRFEKHILKEFQRDVDYQSTRIKPIKGVQAITLLKTMCKKSYNDYLKTGAHIQRFTSTAAQTEYGIMDASKMPDRLSRNTLNYYTQIINHDSTWKNYPRRQVIATYMSSEMGIDTTNYASFIIFPYNNTKIGICQTDDMWDAFPRLNKVRTNARSYNKFINKVLNGGSQGTAYDKSLSEFKGRCKKFDESIGGVKGIKDIQNYYFDIGAPGSAKTLDTYDGDFYKNILRYFNPKGFKMGIGGGGPANDYNEVWFDGPAVFINMAEIDNITLM